MQLQEFEEMQAPLSIGLDPSNWEISQELVMEIWPESSL